jgi:hypothetical protein
MSSYYNAAANSSVLDDDRLQRNSSAVAAYCKKNKTRVARHWSSLVDIGAQSVARRAASIEPPAR